MKAISHSVFLLFKGFLVQKATNTTVFGSVTKDIRIIIVIIKVVVTKVVWIKVIFDKYYR